ncbi:MAG: TolC family protein [Candidatus Methylacidiphilales bacterium]|nr:TolC family protein [Candidatus Methylacidiphilales bacterium]
MRRRFSCSDWGVSLGLVLFLAGCAGAGREPVPRSDMAALAPADGWKAGGGGDGIRTGWIADFGDPRLTALVAEGLDRNPDVLEASARLEAARAAAKRAGAALFPALDLNGAGDRRIPFKGLPSASVGASLDISWELDLWGRIASAKRGAGQQWRASASEYASARQSLAAQIAKSWFLAVEAGSQLDLARDFVASYTRTLAIVQSRADMGTVTQEDHALARADLATSQQSMQAAETAGRESVRSLEILLGRYPAAELKVADSLQAVPPPIPSGLPSEMLERRPDVVAAERQVAAAFQFTQSAAAARLPRLGLTGSLGSVSNALNSLTNPINAATTLGAALFQPLFDAGLRQSEFEEARAEQKAAVARYRAVALRAFQEVENGLDRESSLTGQEEKITEAVRNYGQARKTAEIRYQQGADSLFEVLAVQRQELQARTALIRLRGERLVQRTNLHLALGGDFLPADDSSLDGQSPFRPVSQSHLQAMPRETPQKSSQK